MGGGGREEQGGREGEVRGKWSRKEAGQGGYRGVRGQGSTKGSVLKYLLQHPQFGRGGRRVKV